MKAVLMMFLPSMFFEKILLMTAFLILTASRGQAAIVIHFDELSPPPTGYLDGYGATATSGSWSSQGAIFQTETYGPGWSYSRINDSLTPGFTNQWAAITGVDASGNGNYAIATAPVYPPPLPQAYVNLPLGYRPSSVQVTNTTYAGLAMLQGDAFTTKFGGIDGSEPDFFKVIFTGFDSLNAAGTVTGTADFYLADYRFANNALDYVVNQWTLFDLGPLGQPRSIGIQFDGSDRDPTFGLNTPAYVALDNLTLTAVPEPTSLSLALIGLGLLMRRRPARYRPHPQPA
jgi:hypothetical protein